MGGMGGGSPGLTTSEGYSSVCRRVARRCGSFILEYVYSLGPLLVRLVQGGASVRDTNSSTTLVTQTSLYTAYCTFSLNL